MLFRISGSGALAKIKFRASNTDSVDSATAELDGRGFALPLLRSDVSGSGIDLGIGCQGRVAWLNISVERPKSAYLIESDK